MLRSAQGDRLHFWLVDAPLSLPLALLEAQAIEPAWDAAARWLASFASPREWRRAVREVSRREPKRAVDKLFHAPFSPLNLRVFQQTWHAIVTVLLPLLEHEEVALLPQAMRRAPGALVEPRDVQAGARALIAEGCPSSTLLRLGLPRSGYKGGSVANRARRQEILAGLAGAGGVRLSDESVAIAADDAEGDALDSLVLLAASRRLALVDPEVEPRASGLPAAEGWIYT